MDVDGRRKGMMRTRFVSVAFALILVAAACGGGNDGASEGVVSLSGASNDEVVAAPQPEDETVELTREEALLTFTACSAISASKSKPRPSTQPETLNSGSVAVPVLKTETSIEKRPKPHVRSVLVFSKG